MDVQRFRKLRYPQIIKLIFKALPLTASYTQSLSQSKYETEIFKNFAEQNN